MNEKYSQDVEVAKKSLQKLIQTRPEEADEVKKTIDQVFRDFDVEEVDDEDDQKVIDHLKLSEKISKETLLKLTHHLRRNLFKLKSIQTGNHRTQITFFIILTL